MPRFKLRSERSPTGLDHPDPDKRAMVLSGLAIAAAPVFLATQTRPVGAQGVDDAGVKSSLANPVVRSTPAKVGPLSSRQKDLLLKTLAAADTHGFAHDEFAASDLAAQVGSGAEGAEALLRTAILAYARAQRGQRLPASAFPAEWAIRPAPYDPTPEFAAAVSLDALGPWLDSLPPAYEGYQALRTGLASYRAASGHHGAKAIPDGPPLSGGVDDPRVEALRRRMATEDPGLGSSEHASQFDADLEAAVVRFQRRNGLSPDGVVGAPTLAALNAPHGQRIQQIKANMERWRWLPPTLPPTRVQVNIAAAVLAVYQDDRPVLAMKAVAGKPEDATPMLTSEIRSIVLNPAWHVPDSIARKELWPKAHRDKGYLARNDFVVVRADDGSSRLVQKAGRKSALGHYKFDFSNPFGVYLHDTPAQAGFSRSSRLASHGCVRLAQPKLLADLLLQGDAAWPPERVDEIVAGDRTLRAPLEKPIPVFLFYWTAFVDNTGQVAFRPDSYDWDRKLLDLIAAQKSQA